MTKLENLLNVTFRINKDMAAAAIEVLARQCWWLGERMIPLALFAQDVDEDSRSALAAALESTRVDPAQRQPEEPGKPEFPTLKKSKELKDFVGPQSWTLFNLVDDEAKWLRIPPSEWASDPAFNSTRMIVSGLHGVNDIAEGGCRTADYYKVRLSIHLPSLSLSLCIHEHTHTHI